MLLSFPEYLKENPESEKLVRQSIDFLLTVQKPNGNFPSSMDDENPSLARGGSKDLVHWCHGASGVVFLLAKAYIYFKDQKYLNECLRCSDLVWRQGLLKKGPGICHGVAGSGYVHLLLYRLTNSLKYLYRASRFADFMETDEFKAQARTPDSPYSLFEGLAGTVCFILDLLDPNQAEYPLVPVF
jgi:membrane transport protein XK